ncbi:hypothetical protein J3B02_000988 [Coemansia erecta]|uniref:Pentatricopeptide repeat-containing protein-mitochondrial domain-containing protein n=1 Tax=Coemansia asiatica TaxID=1052880 RepID=A0A9W7XNG5_9FUNG|nr:hypothetical protein LPJ64_002061 [Coemansia asiatica]KAJ2857467.1 hypothetical protein J3B02_000988 [Coemansia erecta]KAJ2888263.1 hypothetical protein FB639_000754 [Coemansia asiatica]
MFTNLTRQLLSRRRAPAISGRKLLARRYVGPIANHEAISALTEKLTVEEQVQKIVNPSTYEQIERTKQIAQSARLQNQDLGTQLANATRLHKESVSKRLQGLYAELQKTKDLSPDDRSAVLAGFSELRDGASCIQVIRDMRLAGQPATVMQFATALRAAAAARQEKAVYTIGEEMQAAGIQDTEENYAVFFEQLVLCLAHLDQAEHAYAVFLEMRSRGFIPSSDASDALVAAMGIIGDSDMALEIMLDAKSRGESMSASTMLKVLHSAAVQLNPEPFKHCWNQLTGVMGVDVTAGDCDAGLDIAARTGDVNLAHNVIDVLRKRGFPISEYHFEALFEALVRDSRWPIALTVLNIMREHGFGKQSMTLRSMIRTIASQGPEKAMEIVDSIFNELLKKKLLLPYAANSVTLDALVTALATVDRAEQAAERLRKWYPELHIRRTPDSYAAVLQGCIASKDKKLAESLLMELVDTDKLKPTKLIYEQMIAISLKQFNYEDAFVYLEALKAHNIIPSWKTYSAIVHRCARVKDPRARVAMKEMADLGYPVTEALQSFVDTHERLASSSSYRKIDSKNAKASGSAKDKKDTRKSVFDINFTI